MDGIYFASFDGYGFNFTFTGFHLPQEIHVNDWYKELEYLRILKETLLLHKLPFFVPNFNELFGSGVLTDKGEFLAMPIYTLSFQSIFLACCLGVFLSGIMYQGSMHKIKCI